MSLRKALLETTMLVGIGAGAYPMVGPALAVDLPLAPAYKALPALADLPAVDGFNAKWEALAGGARGNRLYGSRAALSIPLGQRFGFQLDGGGGALDGAAWGMIGAHLFTRDPGYGMIGVYGSYTNWDKFGGVHVSQAAIEGERYWGRWTLQGIIGAEWGNTAS